MTTLTLSKALNEGLRKSLENDPKVLIMGEDVGKLGGVFRVTDGLQKDFGEHRLVDTPLAESGIIGTAIGLVVGYAISYAGGHYHVLALSPEVYSIDYVPFAPRLIDGIWVALFAVLISFVATLYPSWSAARILPAEALRYD